MYDAGMAGTASRKPQRMVSRRGCIPSLDVDRFRLSIAAGTEGERTPLRQCAWSSLWVKFRSLDLKTARGRLIARAQPQPRPVSVGD